MSDGSHRGDVADDGDAIRREARRRVDALEGRAPERPHAEPATGTGGAA